ncbi:hypothetical protein BOTBODRAFT_331257 [Botryobasidium botryosum FD-172 SS1]|uniref:Uncharacterized protein n=1 Tax=Botryobasidium botryosum (strain FD-172 SS1) TaxID=930990 RepID=A0A067MTI5_BOTB1|nr:hypothetical protein BOTBODRAFT_331257 [Botryobasidium botryosum FD-172 SS1]
MGLCSSRPGRMITRTTATAARISVRALLRNKVYSCVRYSSTYHEKVYAIPFNHPLELARKKATVASGFPTESILAILSVFGETLFGRDVVRSRVELKEFKPVYLPTWAVDAEVEAKVWVGEDAQQGVSMFQSFGSYFPGLSLDPLSGVPFHFSGQSATPPEIVPFSPSMLRYLGQDVIPIPYTLSPLRLPAVAQSISTHDARIADDWRFQPSSVKFPMLAAYPVLFPVYMAAFNYAGGAPDGSDKLITVIVDADKPTSAVHLQFDDGSWLTLSIERRDWVVQQTFLDIPSHTVAPLGGSTPRERLEQLKKYLDARIDGVRWDDVPTEDIDWADARIMPYEKEQVERNREWMALGTKLMGLKEVMRGMPSLGGSTAMFQVQVGSRTLKTPTTPESESSPNSAKQESSTNTNAGTRSGVSWGPIKVTMQEDLDRMLREEIDQVEKKREETKMEWLRRWEASQAKPHDHSDQETAR